MTPRRFKHLFVALCFLVPGLSLLVASSLALAATATPTYVQFLPMVKSARSTTTLKPAATETLYGVLQPEGQYQTRDWEAGIRARTLEIGWDHYQPQDGVWNQAYIQQQQTKLLQMRAAGFQVVLDLGLQYPPTWAKNIRPWKDQYGNEYKAQVNAIWSATVRHKIELYIQHVFQALGTDFWGVRLGSGGWVETLYPDNLPGFQFSYWAFDDEAMASNPVPAWRPGQSSPNGEAELFYTWYLQQLIDTVNWQQDVVRQSYSGYLIQLLPGQGVRPAQWNTLIATNLIPTGKHIHAAERGAVWDKVIDGLRNHTNVIISCSSVGDSSATAASTKDYGTNPLYWSSAHWVAYNADRHGLPKMAENAGRSDYATMQVVAQQMDQFGYSSLFWAFDADLHNGQYATIAQYAALIAQQPPFAPR